MSYMIVQIAENPIPPILNNAVIEWVTLYLGREPYHGITMLSEQCDDIKGLGGYDSDINLYKVREIEQNDLLQRLIEAYDADFPETNNMGAEENK